MTSAEAREVGGSVRLDTAYRGLRADEDGKWRVHVDLPNGTRHGAGGSGPSHGGSSPGKAGRSTHRRTASRSSR